MHRKLAIAAAASALAAAAYAGALALRPGPAAAKTLRLTPGMVLTKPGLYTIPTTWNVAGLEDGKFVLRIDGPGVVLDLNGLGIGTDSTAGELVQLGPNALDVTIRNGRLRGGMYAVRGNPAGSVTCDNLRMMGQAGCGLDLTVKEGRQTVSNSTIENPGVDGVRCTGVPGGNVLLVWRYTDLIITGAARHGLAFNPASLPNGPPIGTALLDRVRVRNCMGNGIQVADVETLEIRDSEIANCQTHGIVVTETWGLNVWRCRISDVTENGLGVFVGGATGGVWRTSVRDCTITGAGAAGITVQGMGGDDRIALDVRGNRIGNIGGTGLFVGTDVAGAQILGSILDNDIEGVGMDAGLAATSGGIDLGGVRFRNGRIASNVISVSALGLGTVGFALRTRLDGGQVSANLISGGQWGMVLVGDDVLVERNIVRGNSMGGVMASGSGNVFLRNVVSFNIGPGFDLALATQSRVEANQVRGNTGTGVIGGAATNLLLLNTLLANGNTYTGATLVGQGNIIIP